MGKKRITGNDRALMFLCVQARKYWRYYSPAYKQTKFDSVCNMCAKRVHEVEVDHVPPLGPRPKTIEAFPEWWTRLMNGPQQGLCKKHHQQKTAAERKSRGQKEIIK